MDEKKKSTSSEPTVSTTYARVILLSDSADLPDSKTADKEAIYLVPKENEHKQKTVTAHQFKGTNKAAITFLAERLQNLTSEEIVFPSSNSETLENPDLANRLASMCWSISPTDLDVLHGDIAPKEIFRIKGEDNEGDTFSSIREHEGIDVGTKILYLERAITLGPSSFHSYLDKLDNPTLEDSDKAKNREFIRLLKRINDLFWNNQISAGGPRALNQFFVRNTTTLKECQTEISYLIQQGIFALKSENSQWAQQRADRLASEKDIKLSYAWRLAVHMPENQLPPDLKTFIRETTGSTIYRGTDKKESIADLCIFAEKYHATLELYIYGMQDHKTKPPEEIEDLCKFIEQHRKIIRHFVEKGWLTIAEIFLLEARPGGFKRVFDYYNDDKNQLKGGWINFMGFYEVMAPPPPDLKSRPLTPPVTKHKTTEDVKTKPLTSSTELDPTYDPSKLILSKSEEEEIARLSVNVDIPLIELQPGAKKTPSPPPSPISDPPPPAPQHNTHFDYVFFKKPSRRQIAEAAKVSFISGVGQLASLALLWSFSKDWVTNIPTDASSIGNLMNNPAFVYGATTLITLILAAGILSVRREAQDAANPAAAQP